MGSSDEISGERSALQSAMPRPGRSPRITVKPQKLSFALQTIVDGNGVVRGYEVLYRRYADSEFAQLDSNLEATCEVAYALAFCR
ncbi:MAG: hypothetical protein KGL39_51410, partial [Patescibacteria group bacterium]|nr:hypothetical protein [Patescibacteria group bacterium]